MASAIRRLSHRSYQMIIGGRESRSINQRLYCLGGRLIKSAALGCLLTLIRVVFGPMFS